MHLIALPGQNCFYEDAHVILIIHNHYVFHIETYYTFSQQIVVRLVFFFQAEDGIRDTSVTGVQTCALPIYARARQVELRHLQRGLHRGHRRVRGIDWSCLAVQLDGAAARHLGRQGERKGGRSRKLPQLEIHLLQHQGLPVSQCAAQRQSSVGDLHQLHRKVEPCCPRRRHSLRRPLGLAAQARKVPIARRGLHQRDLRLVDGQVRHNQLARHQKWPDFRAHLQRFGLDEDRFAKCLILSHPKIVGGHFAREERKLQFAQFHFAVQRGRKLPFQPRLELVHVDQQWQAHHHHHESRYSDANPLYDSAHSRTPPLPSLLLCQWHKAPACASEQSSDFFWWGML